MTASRAGCTALSALCVGVLLASAPHACAAEDVMSVIVGELELGFEVVRYDDSRANPYQVKFTRDGVQSTFEFGTVGHVTSIKVGEENYSVLYYSDGDLEKVEFTPSGGRRNLVEEHDYVVAFENGRRLYACNDCVETWDAVCDDGVPSVCDLLGYGSPISRGADASITTICEIFGTACSRSGGIETCAGQCEGSVGGEDSEDDDESSDDDDESSGDDDESSDDDDDGGDYGDDGEYGDRDDDLEDVDDGEHDDGEYGDYDDDLEDVDDSTSTVTNSCLDSTSDDFRCWFYGTFNSLSFENCGLVDADVPDMIECFETLGKAEVGELILSNNFLTTLSAELLSGLSMMYKLMLENNQLTTVAADAFSTQTAELDQLWFTNNQLTTLPSNVFTPLTGIFSLGLGSNPDLQCAPPSNAYEVILDSDDILDGTCECDPAIAVMCDDGTSCQPGTTGYTCE